MKINNSLLALGAAGLTFGAVLPACADDSEFKRHPIGLSLDLGPTTGIGAAILIRPFDHFGVRGGIHYAKISFPEFEFEDEFGGTTATYDFEMRYQTAPLTLDFYPWKDSNFRICAGVLLNQNEFSLEARGNIEVNDNNYPGEQLNSEISWEKVAPYVSVAGDIFCFDDAQHWSMGWEVGVAYTGSPDVTLTNPTGGISQTDMNTAQQDIQDEADQLKLWVVAKISLNFRF